MRTTTPPISRRRRPARAAVLLAALSAVGLSAGPALAAGAGQGGGTPAAHVAPAPAGVAAPSAFTHPGVLVGRGQLDFVRAKVRAGAQPWKKAYDTMLASPYASLSRTPKARAVVECGAYSNPNHGCVDERVDAISAYTLALVWYVERDDRYARKAMEIMDAWSAVHRDHTNTNAALQAAWAGAVWPRAGEIIRHAYGRWPSASVNRFAGMLRDAYLPEVTQGDRFANYNGNWELTMMDAAIGISVFLEDRRTYDRAMARFLRRVPAYVYLKSDGAFPAPPPGGRYKTKAGVIEYWYGQTTFVDGLSQETCRDFTHTGYGIAAISHVAETARLQGHDIYPQVRERLRHAMGFHARYQLSTSIPSWLCGGSIKLKVGPVTEVGFNALHNRLGIHMPNTQKLTEQQRPAGTDKLFVAWETLTHADNPR
ncbi:alginate lyase family protein [Planomonospora sp. ID67723]|uniref:alginate lyase family protein n=1 Tax=Planomonospora sp. ID67723 TaxID=2738134 RepID=UPI0018C380B8|nr:alginate lyase family protein [Planomonospora sp. ID67723]MBG0828990.1 alginate lyase family protein [Planomonospora sp. ID67723]